MKDNHESESDKLKKNLDKIKAEVGLSPNSVIGAMAMDPMSQTDPSKYIGVQMTVFVHAAAALRSYLKADLTEKQYKNLIKSAKAMLKIEYKTTDACSYVVAMYQMLTHRPQHATLGQVSSLMVAAFELDTELASKAVADGVELKAEDLLAPPKGSKPAEKPTTSFPFTSPSNN